MERYVIVTVLVTVLGLAALCPCAAGAPENDVPARGAFLVADRQLEDPRFMETVVLLLSVDRSGATGLIINKPSDTSISGLFPGMRKTVRRKDRIYSGGPVETKQLLMLLRTKEAKKNTHRIINGVSLTTDRDILMDAIKRKQAGDEFRVYAGYAGWAAGQLEWEIRRGDWRLVDADAATVFHDDESKVWPGLHRKSEEIMVRERNRDASGFFFCTMSSQEKAFRTRLMRTASYIYIHK